MRIAVGYLRNLVSEALKRPDAVTFASRLQASVKGDNRVNASLDDNGKMFNVFVKLITGDADVVEGQLIATAEENGWSLLSRRDTNQVTWWFEPNDSTKGAIPTSKLPNELYHLTPAENVGSILASGMEPRTSSRENTQRRYSPRIYLATNATVSATKSDETFLMVKVDRSKCPKSMKFYIDQEYGYTKDGIPKAVYTTESIPAEAVSLFKR